MNDHLEPIIAGHDVRALLAAEGPVPNVWCATTDSGILKVAVLPRVGVVTSRLGTDYGLPSDSTYAMAAFGGPSTRDAGLVLGTNRGLAIYQPGRTAPGLRLVRVLGRRPYAAQEWPGLQLEYPQNSLLVEAAAIGSRTYPEHFQYVFALSTRAGHSLRSRLSREGQFVTESLPPGGYCLEARALSVDLRGSAPASLCFDVAGAPLPWASIALGFLLGCAILALAWGYRQNRRLGQSNVALSETRLQLVQETENERSRIARDLHDQTLADLRRLLLIAPPFREAIESISTEVRRICEDLSPSVLQNVGLTPALEWALEQSVRPLPGEPACKATFSCAAGTDERLSLDGNVALQIYRMVQEALSNAGRHASATEVRLSVTLDGSGTLEITVEDDGRGFDVRAAAAGRGLANVRSRASLIGADVEWSARPGGGTIFRLRQERAAAR
jgi:signal transduction histidine kinase